MEVIDIPTELVGKCWGIVGPLTSDIGWVGSEIGNEVS